jgi:hypothetical protein
MDKYSNINDKIIQNDSHFANRRNSYEKAAQRIEEHFSIGKRLIAG